MLHIDKFEYLRLISTLLQKLRADTVGDKRGHPLLQQSIAQNRLEQPVTYLAVQLMLAARHGQNYIRSSSDRFRHRVIRGRVAGVERHHHIHMSGAFITGNIAMVKMKILKAEFLT